MGKKNSQKNLNLKFLHLLVEYNAFLKFRFKKIFSWKNLNFFKYSSVKNDFQPAEKIQKINKWKSV